MDVMNCLITRRGYKMQGTPIQRTLPNIHNKDDKYECSRFTLRWNSCRDTQLFEHMDQH